MNKRITITFEWEEEEICKFVEGEGSIISSSFDTFIKMYFSSLFELHIKNIKQNLDMKKLGIEEKKIEDIVINYLKAIIPKQDMLQLQCLIVQKFFEECLSNKREPKEAAKESFKSKEIIDIVNIIYKKLIKVYILS